MRFAFSLSWAASCSPVGIEPNKGTGELETGVTFIVCGTVLDFKALVWVCFMYYY